MVYADLIESLIPSRHADYYFGVPKPFVVHICQNLLAWGIPASPVHFEFIGPREELEKGNSETYTAIQRCGRDDLIAAPLAGLIHGLPMILKFMYPILKARNLESQRAISSGFSFRFKLPIW